MSEFFPNQRWTSETEPELGVGIVRETGKGRVQIEFPRSGEMRLYAAANAPLRRLSFKPGDSVADVEGRSFVIERIDEDGELQIFHGQGRSLSEADLGDVEVDFGLEELLLLGDVHTPRSFALRRQTLEYDQQRRISPVNGLLGGRIDLIPHQLYIAQEVTSRYSPRVLLSDEVGLGKTIEACLILHRLLVSGRINRALILVPETLVHQWFVEMLRRFNLWFHIFDEERCVALEESNPGGNPFFDDQLVLCSIDFLSNSPKRAAQAIKAQWDMLVVDEAHHLEWSTAEASPEYTIVEALSQVAEGLLLLTATPEQLGIESHFARLRLLDPDRYVDFESFQSQSSDQAGTADLVEKLSKGRKLNADDHKLLVDMFGQDRFNAYKNDPKEERLNLIEDLLDQYGPGRVVFRNTRAAMSGFPSRKANLVPLKLKSAKDEAQKGLSEEFLSDTVEDHQQPNYDFASDERVAWIIGFMQEIEPAKALLICRTKEKVLALEKAIREKANFKSGVFHEDLSIVQRDRNAAWFSEEGGARLLICSEIGSEGRNFQFAHHLILFDLPLQPELLEQRIGRLDRIGQTEDIQIHVPFLEGSSQERLIQWYHEGLNAFEKNLQGGNRIMQLFGSRLTELIESESSKDRSKAFTELLKETQAFRAEQDELLTKGRDRLLEMNSFRPKLADELVQEIAQEDRDPKLETYMDRVFDHFGVEVEDLAPRTYLVNDRRTDTEAFPEIPDDGRMITFDRRRALSREDMSFLSWDHPMVTGAIDMVLGTGTGNVSFGVIPPKGEPALLLEVMFVLETQGGQKLNVDRFLPNTPLRVVIDHVGNEVSEFYPVDTLDRMIRPGDMDDILEQEMLVESVIPKMFENAKEEVELMGLRKISSGLRMMNRMMDHEVNRLKRLQEQNDNIREAEIQLAMQTQESLAEIMKHAQIRMDSAQLIQRGEFELY